MSDLTEQLAEFLNGPGDNEDQAVALLWHAACAITGAHPPVDLDPIIDAIGVRTWTKVGVLAPGGYESVVDQAAACIRYIATERAADVQKLRANVDRLSAMLADWALAPDTQRRELHQAIEHALAGQPDDLGVEPLRALADQLSRGDQWETGSTIPADVALDTVGTIPTVGYRAPEFEVDPGVTARPPAVGAYVKAKRLHDDRETPPGRCVGEVSAKGPSGLKCWPLRAADGMIEWVPVGVQWWPLPDDRLVETTPLLLDRGKVQVLLDHLDAAGEENLHAEITAQLDGTRRALRCYSCPDEDGNPRVTCPCGSVEFRFDDYTEASTRSMEENDGSQVVFYGSSENFDGDGIPGPVCDGCGAEAIFPDAVTIDWAP